jgi:hypothetical protein
MGTVVRGRDAYANSFRDSDSHTCRFAYDYGDANNNGFADGDSYVNDYSDAHDHPEFDADVDPHTYANFHAYAFTNHTYGDAVSFSHPDKLAFANIDANGSIVRRRCLDDRPQ